MKLTNKHNLPESVYNLLAKERYNGSSSTNYSVTTLLQPPRITQLKRRHWGDLEEDVMDNVWSLFGHIAHSLLEEHGAENAMSEERIHTTILDRVISGQVDSYHDGIITDYKVTSAWTLVYGSRIKEWTEQLNFYAHLFRSEGHIVRQLRICAILRDWDKNKAKQNPSYPQTPIVIIPLTLWEPEKAEETITYHVAQHKAAEDLLDYQLPECSSEDMWEQPSKYALMKKGRKSAIKLYDTEEETKGLCYGTGLVSDQKDLYIEKRQGKRTRCEDGYCSVRDYCSQYQKYKESLSE